jgi:Circadian oscillating protein COP23
VNTLKSTIGTMEIMLLVTFGIIFPTMLATAQVKPLVKTTFACVISSGNPATIAIRGDIRTSPMIIWKDMSYGGKYTPQKRCEIVSQRLTKAVASSNKLTNLTMTHGILNSLPVICFITRKGEKCNSTNILFSLKSSERGQEQAILDDLLNFSKVGKGTPTTRGGAKPKTLGEAIEQELTNSDQDQ